MLTHHIIIYSAFPCTPSDKPNAEKNFIDDNNVSIYKTKRTISTSLFTADTRPLHVQQLYEKAVATPVIVDDSNDNDSIVVSSVAFIRTRRHITKKIDAEIETRVVSFAFFISSS